MLYRVHFAILLATVSIFQFATAGMNTELALGTQQWQLISETSSPDFADVVYELVKEDDDMDGFAKQFLRIAIAKDSATFAQMENRLFETFDRVAQGPAIEGEHFRVRETTVVEPGVSLPLLIALTAVHNTERPDFHVALQYWIKPHCKNCLETAKTWTERIAHASIASGETTIFFSEQNLDASIDIQPLVFTVGEQGFFKRIYNDYAPYMVGFGATVGTFLFFGGKCILGVMGYSGPCGNNMVACRCGQ